MQGPWRRIFPGLLLALVAVLFSAAACETTLTPGLSDLATVTRSQETTPTATPENDSLAPQPPRGNRIRLANFSVEDGLSQSVAKAILQFLDRVGAE